MGGAIVPPRLRDIPVNASRDLAASDIGNRLVCDSSASAILLSIPASLMSSVNLIVAQRVGANAVTFAPKGGSGVTLNDPYGVSAANHALVGILWESADTYTLMA